MSLHIDASDYKEITRKSYDQTAIEYQEKTIKLQPTADAGKFLSCIPQKSKILDVGCGPGRDAKYFSSLGHKVVGVDLSSKMIELAKASVPSADFFVMDVENLCFPKHSFDAVWASASLLHVPKQKLPEVLHRIHALLKPNGILYVSMKKGTGEILSRDERYDGVEKFWAYMNEQELISMLESQGFHVLEDDTHEKSTEFQTHPWISVIAKKIL